jgi:hypothetical protein
VELPCLILHVNYYSPLFLSFLVIFFLKSPRNFPKISWSFKHFLTFNRKMSINLMENTGRRIGREFGGESIPMASNENNPKKNSGESDDPFTIGGDDSDSGEMPSLTKLLDRKSLNLSSKPTPPKPPSPPPQASAPVTPPPFTPPPKPMAKPPTPPPAAKPQAKPPQVPPKAAPPVKAPPAPPPVSAPVTTPEAAPPSTPSEYSAPLEIEISFEDSPASNSDTADIPLPARAPELPEAPAVHAKVQPAIRKSVKKEQAHQQLNLWTVDTLKSSSDPLGKGILMMIEKGAISALYLSVVAAADRAHPPTFSSSATVNPDTKLNLWTGLTWNPTFVPEAWNTFTQAGMLELAPPETRTNAQSFRNVIRTAFGIQSGEWLLLVRAGPAKGVRGVIAFISTKSIAAELSKALPLLSAAMK